MWSVLSTLIHHLYHISITLLQDQKDTCHPQRLYIYISCFKKEETLLFIKVNGNISSEKESCGLYILWIININHITQTFPSENKYPQDSDPQSRIHPLLPTKWPQLIGRGHAMMANGQMEQRNLGTNSQAKYLSAGVNLLGEGNEFGRREWRVNSFLGMSNSAIQFHHYPECREKLDKGPSEGS